MMDTDRYSEHNMGVTQPLHSLVPIDMAHKDNATLGDNWVQFGLPDNLVPAEEEHEEGNLAPSDYGREKGGPLNPILREGATRTQNPHWATEGFHDKFRARIKSLDKSTSDGVLYGALDDYKKLGLVLSDEFVSPTHDAEEREKEFGSHPQFFEERFKPLAKYASTKQWREEVHPDGGWAVDDADAFEKAEGNVTDKYAGRSAVEQRLLYGSADPFNLGHPVDSETDNGDSPFADGRMKGPGDGAPMPAFPRDTNAMERHPWTDQGHVFFDEYGAKQGGIVDTGRSNTTV
jgi:hypothetical protein